MIGVDNYLIFIIDILYEVFNVNLVVFYGFEYGVWGDVYVGDKVDNVNDFSIGLFVYLFYGKICKLIFEMLKDIDVLVYDI